MSRWRKATWLGIALLAGCEPPLQFGPARSWTAEQRPTRWDEPAARRLPVAAGQPAPASPFEFTAPTVPGFAPAAPAPQRFRDLVWTVAGRDGAGDAECWLTASVGGGVAANLSRWAAQFGVAAPEPERLPTAVLAGETGRLVELSGTADGVPGQGMLLVFTVRGETLTTLKLTGPAATVAASRAGFLELARGLRSAPKSAAKPAGHPKVGHVPTVGGAAELTATTPAGWTPQPGAARALEHTFGSRGQVHVGSLTGTLRRMVDVWRGEFGLPGLSEAELGALPAIPLLGGNGLRLQLAGDWQERAGVPAVPGTGVWVAAVQDGPTVRFVRMVGEAAEVDAQGPAFLAFCASLRRAP